MFFPHDLRKLLLFFLFIIYAFATTTNLFDLLVIKVITLGISPKKVLSFF